MSNREVEDLAIQHVLKLERAAGRNAEDSRGRGALADIEGDRTIEVKAYGKSARGNDMWLETKQVEAALADPERFHLVLVENIRQGDPDLFRVIDIHGKDLAGLLDRRRESTISKSHCQQASTTDSWPGRWWSDIGGPGSVRVQPR